jgi:hypothetical protein
MNLKNLFNKPQNIYWESIYQCVKSSQDFNFLIQALICKYIHGDVPPYNLAKIATFGTVNKIVSNGKEITLSEAISLEYQLEKYKDVELDHTEQEWFDRLQEIYRQHYEQDITVPVHHISDYLSMIMSIEESQRIKNNPNHVDSKSITPKKRF